ncbi:MAG TPA: hypothetical protein VMK42_06125 [Anaeromyxobacteraceae bacterium]|nr:hypothetical protein [Anaeromyxobacteraceae bacterium]
MPGEWPAYQVVGAFFALVVSAGIGLKVLVSLARKTIVRRHVVVEGWLPLAPELARRGVEAPEVIAALLASYDLALERPEKVTARLPAAVATVSDALQIQLLEIARPLVARAWDEAGASALLDELRSLRPRLEGLPGVVRVGPLWPDDAGTLSRLVSHYASMVALPLPGKRSGPGKRRG